MPARGPQRSKKIASTTRVYSGSRLGGSRSSKVMTASQVQQQKQLLEEKRKKEEDREFYRPHRYYNAIIVFFSTGMAAIMRQKVAELGMAANQAPGAIDWEVVPDGSIFDDRMEVDVHLDDWEDVPEDSLDAKGQATGQKAMQRARLQTIIMCVLVFFCAVTYL
jgi:hypothetical protein